MNVHRAEATGEGDVLLRRHAQAAEQQDRMAEPCLLDFLERCRIHLKIRWRTDHLCAECAMERFELHDRVSFPSIARGSVEYFWSGWKDNLSLRGAELTWRSLSWGAGCG